MKAIIFILFSFYSVFTFASEETLSDLNLVKLTPEEESSIVSLGKKASDRVSQKLMKTMLADIKSVGIAEAARGWSKSIAIINNIADSFELGMTIRRPTYQYRNPINKPDAIDKLALDFFLSDESENKQYFARKIIGKDNSRYVYYQPMYVTQKCLLCHSSNMSDDIKKVLEEKYPDDHSNNLKLAALRAAIRVELPESAIKSGQ